MALRPNSPQSRSDQLAAARAAQGNVFAREVDDALRADAAMDAVRRWGIPVGAALVAGLIGLGGWLWYDTHQANQRGIQGESMTQVLDQVEAQRTADVAAPLGALIKNGTPGYKATAQLLQAGIAQDQAKGDATRLAKVAGDFAAVASDSAAPQALRDLASIREVAIRFDAMAPQQVVDRLKPLAVPGNPWFGSAGELVAMAYLRQNKPDLAGPLFAALAKDKTVPDSIRQRARQMAGALGVDAVGDVADLMAQSAGQAAGQ